MRLVRLDRLPGWIAHRDLQDIDDPADDVRSMLNRGKLIWEDADWQGQSPRQQIVNDVAVRRETKIRRFRRAVGIPPAAYALAVRLDHARRLLAEGAAQAAIAADLGFSDQSHLGRQFRAAYGITPARYAASLRQPKC